MGSDEERLEEMLKAVMETENEKVPVPEVPIDDFPEIPLEDFPEIPLDEIPEMSEDEISEMPVGEIPEESMEDSREIPEKEATDSLPENLSVEDEDLKEAADLPQESQRVEPEVDPLELLAMSEEEIDKVLEEEAALGERFSRKENGGEVSEPPKKNSDLSEIEELLQMSDNHEQVDGSEKSGDMPSRTMIPGEKEMKSVPAAGEGEEDAEDLSETPEKEKKKKEKREKRKEKKEKKKENSEEKEGLGKKLASMFFGSDEEPEEDTGDEKEKKTAEVKEKKKKEKKEKKKKEPKKKEADPKKAAKEKQQREKNAEKAKKKAEKAAQAEKERRAAKKLPKKKVIVWVVLCASIGVGILLLNSVGMATIQLTDARNAFDDKDFETAYRLLNGKELSEEDQLRFSQSSAILHLEHSVETYENHLSLKKPVKALDDLMTGVDRYQKILQEGNTDLITPELTAAYQTILGILQENYSLSEEGALEINALESDYEYSLQLEALVNGEVYQSQAELEQQEEEEAANLPDLEDMLPEEEEYFNDSSD